jgi:spermidine synthase
MSKLNRSFKVGIFALFFFSGISALIYEVAWLRLLTLTVGSTAESTSCVLAVFLGGLAIGNWFGGKLADKFNGKELIAYYGKLEIGIAVTAPVVSFLVYKTPYLLAAFCHQFGEAGPLIPLMRILISCTVLLIPTILMGATSPTLTRYVTFFGTPARSFARLYALNTLGAVLGGLLACFVGFAYLGIAGTIIGAAVINLLIAVCVFQLAKKIDTSVLDTSSATANEDPGSTELSQEQRSNLVFLCTLSALVGFGALSYEVLWTRMLRFYSYSSTYSFTIMVSSFLLGLGLGSLIFERLHRNDRDFKASSIDLGFAQYLASIACAASLVAMPLAALLIRHQGMQSNQIQEIVALIATGLIFITPAATAVGLTFPMIGGMAAGFKKVGMAVGAVYAANTIGCVVGALFVGLIFQPIVGSYKAFQITVLLSTIIGSMAVWKGGRDKNIATVLFCIVPPALAGMFVAFSDDPIRVAIKEGDSQILQYGEDTTGIVAVVKHPDFKELRTNSASVSTTSLPAKRYMRLLGVLPTLLTAKPENVLVICFGTGTTAGAQAVCPQVKHMDIVELSPMVLKVAHQFANSNLDVVQKNIVSAKVADGRNYLLCSSKKYDVITLEPPPLTEAGVVGLYSKEFYEILKDHLNPGGVVCQWVPSFYESSVLWRMTVQSVRQTFPHSTIWVSNNNEAILLASEEALKIDPAKMQSAIDSSPTLKILLAEVGLDDAYRMLGTFILGGAQLDRYVGDVQPITDNHPQMEFYLPYREPFATFKDLEAAAGPGLQCMKESLNWQNVDEEALKAASQRVHVIRGDAKESRY